MSTQNPSEIWQVEVGGQIYDAPFEELGAWIGDGALLPQDKVRKGNLRWIEARKVPTLIPFFNAKEQGLPMPVVVNTTAATSADVTVDAQVVAENFPSPAAEATPVVAGTFAAPVFAAASPEPVEHVIAVPTQPQSVTVNPEVCAMHPEIPSMYICDGCGNGFCKTCPSSYGGTVKICPFCGAMCQSKKEAMQKREVTDRRTTAIVQGFGASDFFNALGHPFKFKTSLFFGAVMFACFSLGQGVWGFGGIYMIVSGLFCMMMANMLTFGVLANTIDNFAHGHLESNFMPSFDDFELWNDVIQPFFLSIGAYLSAFGPFFLVMMIGFYWVVSSVNSEMQTFQQNVEKIPGTHYYDTQRTVDQSKNVKNVLGEVADEHNQRIEDYEAAAQGDTAAVDPNLNVAERENRQQEEIWAQAQQQQKKSLESVLGKTPETEAKEKRETIQSFLRLAAPLVVIGTIFFLWGIFYFPAACAVAGYTRSFTATINPLVGLDTIKRLGGAYVKILLMGIVLIIASAIFSGILAIIFAPFDMPAVGNLPAKFIGALFTFYLSVTFSCILGYALFKKSDKLALN